MNESTLTVTRTREDAKALLKGKPVALQAACDMVFKAGTDAIAATMTAHEKESITRTYLYQAAQAYPKKNKDDKSYIPFRDFACELFGFSSAPAVTNAIKVAESIDIPAIPNLPAWYGTFQLYELRGVPADALKADMESGVLHAGMTTAELREYRKAYEDAHAIEDDTPKLVPLFRCHFTSYNAQFGNPPASEWCEDMPAADIVPYMLNVVGYNTKDTNRVGTFDPVAEDENGRKGKGKFVCRREYALSCIIFPVARSKKAEEKQGIIAKLKALSDDDKAAILAMLSK